MVACDSKNAPLDGSVILPRNCEENSFARLAAVINVDTQVASCSGIIQGIKTAREWDMH